MTIARKPPPPGWAWDTALACCLHAWDAPAHVTIDDRTGSMSSAGFIPPHVLAELLLEAARLALPGHTAEAA
jgi:hypothetical protein